MLERDTWISVLVWAKQVFLGPLCFCEPQEESVCTSSGRGQPNTHNIHTKVGIGFDIGMFGLMLEFQLLPDVQWLPLCSISSKARRACANIAPVASCIARFAPPLPLFYCHVTQRCYRGSRSERHTIRWRLTRSFIRAERKAEARVILLKSVKILLSPTWEYISCKWYQYRRHQSRIYLLLWYRMDTKYCTIAHL